MAAALEPTPMTSTTPSAPSTASCECCGKADAHKQCSRCKKRYCSEECQLLDWNEGAHKENCVVPARLLNAPTSLMSGTVFTDEQVTISDCCGCGKTNGGIVQCEGCKEAVYCDTSCKSKDWEDGHKDECGGVHIAVDAQIFFPPRSTGTMAGRHGFLQETCYTTAPNTLKPHLRIADEHEMMTFVANQCLFQLGKKLEDKGHELCFNGCGKDWTTFCFSGTPGKYTISNANGAVRVGVQMYLFPCCPSTGCSQRVYAKIPAAVLDANMNGTGIMMDGAFYPSSGNPLLQAIAGAR